jgi:AcrR family transcriptional regulator
MDQSFRSKRRHDPVGTRAAIVEAAMKCFAQYGYEGASLGDIAKAAGTNKSAIAFHFGNKEGLWRECLAQRAAPMIRVMDRFIKGEVTAADLIRARVDLHQRYPEFGRLFAWASMEPVPIPDIIAERKEGLLHQISPTGDDKELMRFLFALAAIDGWFLFRNLYRKLVGDGVLAPEAEEMLRETVARALERK